MADIEVHLLDVGAIEYGDAILCRAAGKNILIDGGKKASSRPTQGRVKGRTINHLPIQEQIEAILDSTEVDLLVVTHCHSDHVGNLPALIRDGEISCRFALLADPQFGFGITGDSDEPGPAFDMTPAEKLWMALREEPIHSADDAVIRQFIEDSAAEYEEYVGLVNFLRDDLGADCVIYRGPSDEESPGLDALLEEFSGTGLKIFGPSQAQLGNCALFLVGRDEDVADIQSNLDRAGRVDLAAAYREAVALLQAEDAEDAGSNGNAVNNQSLVLSLGAAEQRVLLTGDMQFAKPQVNNDIVEAEMARLRDEISADVDDQGPFGFVKLSHHGATNGQDLALLRSWGGQLFGISTGSNSGKHPTVSTLTALKDLKDEVEGIKWVRNDMNGRVSYIAEGEQRSVFKERGRFNDLTPPTERAGDAVPEEEVVAATGSGPAPPSVSLEPSVGGNIEVVVRLPYARTRLSVTIDVEPGGSGSPLP